MAGRNLEEKKELFYAYLRENGLKKTHQKDLVLETFLATEGHLSVEDVYSLVKKKDKKVGSVTVFRTLKSLTACGIAREIKLGDGLTRFEHSYHHPHHHHIVCMECHKAIEFVSPELESVQDKIVHKYRFQPVSHRFQIYGICEHCRENRPVPMKHEHDTEKIFARDAIKMAICMESRGIDFYREAATRNRNPSGREILEYIAEEERSHLNELEEELSNVIEQEAGLEKTPIFLHFDLSDLERLVPDLKDYEVAGKFDLDARKSLEMAMIFESRAAEFFEEYAVKFRETQGKKIFEHFAADERKHYEVIRRRAENLLAVT